MSNATQGLPKVTIIGVGLIGGSLALSWKARQVVGEIVGVARRPETIKAAIEVGAIDRGTLSLEEGVRDADVVIIATPVRTILPTAIAVKDHLKEGAIVTDVGSTKSWLCQEVWRVFGDEALFIGGHPMAGSERAGVEAADPYLFQNAPFILVPPPGHGLRIQEKLEQLQSLVRATGAIPLTMSGDQHDAIVATVSHLPHLVAASLVNTATFRSTSFPLLLELAAGGFRDTTRIASGIEDVWIDICQTNAEPIAESMEVFLGQLTEMLEAVKSRDEEALRALLSRARKARDDLPAKSKGILGTVFDIVVEMVDRPGAIHEITGIIGRAGINVIDIEILRVREGEGGTLRLGFEREADLKEALKLLHADGYRARRR